MDEMALAEQLGILTSKTVKDIVYSRTTGRVSVNWVARTSNRDEAIRFVLLCPSNDCMNSAKANN